MIDAPSANPLQQLMALWQQNRLAEALAKVEELLPGAPQQPVIHELRAAILAQCGRSDDAAAAYGQLVEKSPADSRLRVRFGNALRAAGQTRACIEAYRHAAILQPELGEAWCSLANLKTYRFTETEIRQMQAQVEQHNVGRESEVAFHFALGRALGDENDYAQSFAHYRSGNALWRSGLTYNSAATSAFVGRCIDVFTPAFFAGNRATGQEVAAPIFVVGLPRAGSTLVEQILAAHPLVEGAGELPEIMSITAEIDRATGGRYPETLRTFSEHAFRRLSQRYIDRGQIYRRSGRAHFVDKMPNNFVHVGIIQRMFPDAKVIDVRRAPMACCFANFAHHFARGQQFAYDLQELARYYADYVRIMAHWDAVLPGEVYRLQYERLVENPEAEIRTLLAFLGLPFEAACLRFFEAERPVRSASSEQVRQPIFRDSLEFWRHYEPWLGALREALGELAES